MSGGELTMNVLADQPFDKLVKLLAIRLSPQADKSLVIRANGFNNAKLH